MAKVIVTDTHLTDIANAIRDKKGTSDTYKPSEMANAIKNIECGAEPILQDIVVSPKTTEQTITPSEDYDGIGQVKVNAVTSSIDSNIKAENIKKGVTILGITGILETGSGGSTEGVELDLSSYQYTSKSVKANGTEASYDKWYMSEHIKCDEYNSIKYQLPAYRNTSGNIDLVGVAFYDTNKTFISGIGKLQAGKYVTAPWVMGGFSDVLIIGTNEIPQNTVYIRIAKHSEYQDSYVTLIKGGA